MIDILSSAYGRHLLLTYCQENKVICLSALTSAYFWAEWLTQFFKINHFTAVINSFLDEEDDNAGVIIQLPYLVH